MTTNFDSIQTLKSSDVCNKYSKSVSYETLVGGTATTGREIKQTRRLSKGSADKPLSAVGTLTSLLCNSAKVMEKLLYRHSEPKAKNPKKQELSLSGASSEKQKESSLILRKAKFQAIFKFVLPLASNASSYKQPQNVVYNADGEVFLSRRRTTVKRGEIRKRVPEDKSCKLLSRLEGIKYNRISAFVSMPVLLIRRSLECLTRRAGAGMTIPFLSSLGIA